MPRAVEEGVSRWFFTILALAGCETFEPGPPMQEPSLAASVQAIEQRMHARYRVALDMEAAVATGDLQRVRASARLIDALDEPELLARWQPHFDLVRASAHRVAVSESLETAAGRVADVGRACARCHEAASAAVRFTDAPRPAEHATLADAMRHHQWAGLQMWQGLIGPDDGRWRAGAQALTEMPSNLVALASPDDIDAVARIKLEATRALETTRQDPRAVLFGRILASCTACHIALRDR